MAAPFTTSSALFLASGAPAVFTPSQLSTHSAESFSPPLPLGAQVHMPFHSSSLGRPSDVTAHVGQNPVALSELRQRPTESDLLLGFNVEPTCASCTTSIPLKRSTKAFGALSLFSPTLCRLEEAQGMEDNGDAGRTGADSSTSCDISRISTIHSNTSGGYNDARISSSVSGSAAAARDQHDSAREPEDEDDNRDFGEESRPQRLPFAPLDHARMPFEALPDGTSAVLRGLSVRNGISYVESPGGRSRLNREVNLTHSDNDDAFDSGYTSLQSDETASRGAAVVQRSTGALENTTQEDKVMQSREQPSRSSNNSSSSRVERMDNGREIFPAGALAASRERSEEEMSVIPAENNGQFLDACDGGFGETITAAAAIDGHTADQRGGAAERPVASRESSQSPQGPEDERLSQQEQQQSVQQLQQRIQQERQQSRLPAQDIHEQIQAHQGPRVSEGEERVHETGAGTRGRRESSGAAREESLPSSETPPSQMQPRDVREETEQPADSDEEADKEPEGDAAVKSEENSSSEEEDAGGEGDGNTKPFYGCQHYRRRCKVVAPCCGEAFWCRHCHNDVKCEQEKDFRKAHEIDRTAVVEVICAVCETRQGVSNECINCKAEFGKYYCSKCKFWDDKGIKKKVYHCDLCGLCRTGGAESFFHCTTCGSCYSTDIRGSHTCVEKAMHQPCPICCENMFTSIRQVHVLKCGHTLHADCLERLKSECSGMPRLRCPLCFKSLGEYSVFWRRLDEEVERTPLPEELRRRVSCTCNDCAARTDVEYHIVGLKCGACGSYNTRETGP